MELYKSYDLMEESNGEYVGSACGYVSNNLTQLSNFLSKNDYFEEDIDVSKYKNKSFGIIESIFVEDKYRNRGYGTTLLENIIAKLESNGIDFIFIVADGITSNEIKLTDWYEDYGFEIIKDKFNCPLMIKI